MIVDFVINELNDLKLESELAHELDKVCGCIGVNIFKIYYHQNLHDNGQLK